MTQDTTPPGPIFKTPFAPHQGGRQPRKGRCWKDFADFFPKTCRLVLESCLVRKTELRKSAQGVCQLVPVSHTAVVASSVYKHVRLDLTNPRVWV